KETVERAFDEAQRTNSPLQTHLHMASIYERSDKLGDATCKPLKHGIRNRRYCVVGGWHKHNGRRSKRLTANS
ncbi:MAG: hypothetical protein QNK91_10985, partial [Parasphingorhabdus sp.]